MVFFIVTLFITTRRIAL